MGRVRAIYRLPVEPFAEWLENKISRNMTIDELERMTGMDSTHIGKFLHRRYKTVTLDQVDKVLCAEGSTHLRELYPEIYEESWK